MRIRHVLAAGALVFMAAFDANAEDEIEEIQLDAVRAPAATGTPSSVAEYNARARDLKQALRAGSKAGNDAEVEDIRAEIRALKAWYDENTRKRDTGLFIGGIVMSSLGAAAFGGGLAAVIVGIFPCGYALCGGSDNTLVTAGAILAVSGLVVGLTGIPVTLYGNKRIVKSDATASLVFTVGGLGLQGSF